MAEGCKALVVEDSEFIRQVYRIALRRIGDCEVVQTRNGAEAMAALNEHPHFELAIVDINLPVMNGAAFVERMLQMPQHADTKVLIATTESRDPLAALLTRPTVEYLRKPFELEELRAALRKLLPARG